jgi:hypothetical protein
MFVFVLGSSAAQALINPNYTPVDLVYQSFVILRLEIGPPDADGQVPVTIVNALNRPRILTVNAGGDATLFSLPGTPETDALAAGGPCLVADFDGDCLPDVVQTRSGGLLLYRGTANRTFSPPQIACSIRLGQGVSTALTGDYDADHSLDIVLGGDNGCLLLTNRGDGRFVNTLFEAGEVEYNAQAGVVDGTNCDIDNDGRQDFVLFYGNIAAQTFFNRGFRCFGYALETALDRYDLPAALAALDGQQAGTVGDFNADGSQDLAFVTTDGQVWLLLRAPERGPGLGVSVALAPGQTGPVSVVGFDRDRCLGAQRLTAGVPALFGKRTKGPIRLKWQRYSQPVQTKQVIVLQPTRFQVPGE